MHKFFVDSSNIIDNNVNIIGDDVKHIYKVLRLSVGDIVAIKETKKEYSIWFSDSDGIPKYSLNLGYNPAYEETWLGDSGWPNPYSCLFVESMVFHFRPIQ